MISPTDMGGFVDAARTDTSAPTKAATPQEVARQAEALFARTLLKEVRKAMPKDGLLGGDKGTAMWNDLFDEEIADRIAESGGLGVGEQILRMMGEDPKALPPSRATARLGHPHADVHSVTEGRISSGYGTRRDPMHGAHRRHHGVDIAAAPGTPIRALRDGVVTFSGKQGGYGNVVIVDHGDGVETRYAHAQRLDVQAGQAVRAGESIATVGSTGRSTGAHLHFEVRRHGAPMDPEPFLSGGAPVDHPQSTPDSGR